MENKQKKWHGRDIINHLQTLPRDMECRVLVVNQFTEEKCYLKIEDIEIHEVGEEVPDRPWINKVITIKTSV